MKLIKNVPTEFNVKFLGFSVPADSSDFYCEDIEGLNRFNQYSENDNVLKCLIDIDLGNVVNFTANTKIVIFDKCVDEGTYVLYDEEMNPIVEYEGYVPTILEVNEKGYGDYLNFTINPDGTIKNWKNHIDEIASTIFDEWKDETNN